MEKMLERYQERVREIISGRGECEWLLERIPVRADYAWLPAGVRPGAV